MPQSIWPVVILGAFILWLLPLIVAAIRRAEPVWLVVLLLALTPFGGWFVAWIVVFLLPRNRIARPQRHVRPYPAAPPRGYDVPPDADLAALFLPRDRAGAGRR